MMIHLKVTTTASYHVSQVLVKNKKPFNEGNIVEEAFLGEADILLEDFKSIDHEDH